MRTTNTLPVILTVCAIAAVATLFTSTNANAFGRRSTGYYTPSAPCDCQPTATPVVATPAPAPAAVGEKSNSDVRRSFSFDPSTGNAAPAVTPVVTNNNYYRPATQAPSFTLQKMDPRKNDGR